jgi:hypothetical protein
LTYLAEELRVEIVSAGDAAFFQRRGGAGEGGEADCKGGDSGGEVDHFLIVDGGTVERLFVTSVTWRGYGCYPLAGMVVVQSLSFGGMECYIHLCTWAGVIRFEAVVRLI